MDRVDDLEKLRLELSDEDAIKVAAETNQQLARKGWCAWKCAQLGGDIIIVAADSSITGLPAGYPVYTVEELQVQAKMTIPMMRLAHEAKKSTGAQIISQEKA